MTAREIAGLILRHPPRRWPWAARLLARVAVREAALRWKFWRLGVSAREGRRLLRVHRLTGNVPDARHK